MTIRDMKNAFNLSDAIMVKVWDKGLEDNKLYDSLEEATEVVDEKVYHIPPLKEYLKIYELKEVK